MKLSYLLPIALGLLVASCGTKTDSKPATDTADSAAVAAVDTTAQKAAEATDTTAAAAGDVVTALTPADKPAPTADKAVVIDFSATWCGPCQQFKPIYHKVAGEYAQKATFYSADTDECPDLAKQYDVTSIPCVVILREGKEPVSHVGFLSESEFKDLLNANL